MVIIWRYNRHNRPTDRPNNRLILEQVWLDQWKIWPSAILYLAILTSEKIYAFVPQIKAFWSPCWAAYTTIGAFSQNDNGDFLSKVDSEDFNLRERSPLCQRLQDRGDCCEPGVQSLKRHLELWGTCNQISSPQLLQSIMRTRPNSWAEQVREIEWGHWTLDFMTSWFMRQRTEKAPMRNMKEHEKHTSLPPMLRIQIRSQGLKVSRS